MVMRRQVIAGLVAGCPACWETSNRQRSAWQQHAHWRGERDMASDPDKGQVEHLNPDGLPKTPPSPTWWSS